MTGKRPLDNISHDEIAAARAGARSKAVDIACPICGPQHKGASARRKVLRTWSIGGDRISLHCARCGIEGWVAPDAAKPDQYDETERKRRNADLAKRIWREARQIAGTAGETYLRKRGIELATVPDYGGLRWHPNCPWNGRETAACVVARFTDVITGEPRGIHRRPIGGQKPRTLGSMRGCVIRLWPDDAVSTGLVLGEGVETTLAASQIEHRATLLRPAWAAGSAVNMANFPVLPSIEALTLLVDHDANGAGPEAAAACARRWLAEGREAIRLTPKAIGADFNDIIKGERGMSADYAGTFDEVYGETEAERRTREASNGNGGNGKAQHSRAVPLTFFDELSETPSPKPWLIKNVISRDETSSWIAPPGKGKSALLTDIAVHKAGGLDWRGFRTKGRSGVVYFALERADLVRRRLVAHKQRDGLKGLPIAVAGEVIDLLNRNCVNVILATIHAAEQRFGCEVGLAIFDTYSKGIAAGGGDEDKAKDQNLVQANLRRVFDRGCHIHIAGIGHTGKDESKGERGSNARLADVDVQVQIAGDLIKTATIKKANDQPEGLLTSFKLEPFDFGLDEDGDPFRTFIVSPEIFADEHGTVDKGQPIGR